MDDATRRKRSYAAGHLLSLAGKPLPLNTKREPVAYIYNGVRLPKLPEWDMERYPYATILYSESRDLAILLISTYRAFYTTEDANGVSGKSLVVGYYGPRYKITDNQWTQGSDLTGGGASVADDYTVVWSNFDILDGNGDVYVAAGVSNDPDAPVTPADSTPLCVDKSIKYKYGEYTLPALPDFDIRVYPYVVMFMWSGAISFVLASRDPAIYGTDTSRYTALRISFNADGTFETFDDWSSDRHILGKFSDTGISSDMIYWTNHDIKDADGNVVVKGSEPIPVYE